MAEVQIQELFDKGVQYGHRRSKWNPKMKKNIYAEKDGIHVINLEKTKEGLEKACAFLKVAAQSGKKILFVGTKPQASTLIANLAKDLGASYVSEKWPAGLLTNWDVFSKRVRYLKDLRTRMESGDLEEKYTKKEVSRFKKEIEKLETTLGGVEKMGGMPDVLFVIDPFKETLAIKEARLKKIPIVSMVDTNGNPDYIDYVIPANDDSMQSINLILGYIKDACKNGGSASAPKSNVKKMTTETAA